jgi:hypothetical protein
VSEIDVVVDVRLNEKLELVVTRQGLAIDGTVRPAAAPRVETYPLRLRRAEVAVSQRATLALGAVLLAKVTNSGSLTLPAVSVALTITYPQSRDPGSYYFVPEQADQPDGLEPGESRNFYLPPELFSVIPRDFATLPGDSFAVVVLAGAEEVAAARGDFLLTFLKDVMPPGRVRLDHRVRSLIKGLDASDRAAVNHVIAHLEARGPQEWPGAAPSSASKPPDALPLYFMPASPALWVAVRGAKGPGGDGFDVVDVMPADAARQFMRQGT